MSKINKLQEIALDLLEKYVEAQATVICEYSHDIEGENERLQQYKQEMIRRINRAAKPGPVGGYSSAIPIDRIAIRKLLKKSKLRWADIGPQIGYAPGYCVNRVCVGVMQPEMIAGLAKVFGVDPSELEAKA